MAIRRPRKPVTARIGTNISTNQTWEEQMAKMANLSGVGPQPNQVVDIAPESFADAEVPLTDTPAERAARQARERARAVRYSSINDEETTDATNYGEMLRRYRENLPKQRRNAAISANRMGLLNSTTFEEQKGDIETNHARGEADMQSARDERKAARETAKRLLAAGGELEDAEALLGSAQSRGAEYEEMADEGMLAAIGPSQVSKLAPGIQARSPLAKPKKVTPASAGRRNPLRITGGRQQRTTTVRRRRPRRTR